ncbi:hypothetical protein GCM10027026_05000 [Myroides odoratimimus subsp. xuanwuensis]
MLAGYLIGVVTGPDAVSQTTGTVESFNRTSNELCLSGDAVAEADGADDGRLCGIWRRDSGSTTPSEGDSFRFVSVQTPEAPDDEDDDTDTGRVYIYGDVVD